MNKMLPSLKKSYAREHIKCQKTVTERWNKNMYKSQNSCNNSDSEDYDNNTDDEDDSDDSDDEHVSKKWRKKEWEERRAGKTDLFWREETEEDWLDMFLVKKSQFGRHDTEVGRISQVDRWDVYCLPKSFIRVDITLASH